MADPIFPGEVSHTIRRLKARVPELNGRVFGAATLDLAIDEQQGTTRGPDEITVVVVFAGETAAQPQDDVDHVADVTSQVLVILFLDNTRDQRGQTSVSWALELWRDRVIAALHGWAAGQTADRRLCQFSRPVRYAGGQVVNVDRARLEFAMTFEFRRTISQQPEPDDAPDAPAPSMPFDVGAGWYLADQEREPCGSVDGGPSEGGRPDMQSQTTV